MTNGQQLSVTPEWLVVEFDSPYKCVQPHDLRSTLSPSQRPYPPHSLYGTLQSILFWARPCSRRKTATLR